MAEVTQKELKHLIYRFLIDQMVEGTISDVIFTEIEEELERKLSKLERIRFQRVWRTVRVEVYDLWK